MQKQTGPFTIYMTFGLVATISLIMSTFIGSGMALWYPSLIKPDFSIPLSFAFIIRVLIAVMFGLVLYFSYAKARNIQEKWVGFFSSVLIFFLSELFYVLFFYLRSITFYLYAESILFLLGMALCIFFIKCNRYAAWVILPFLLWTAYQIPWAYTLLQLNA